jgi:Ca2+:H+ antiporter
MLWTRFPLKTAHRWLNLLLLFVPGAIVLDLLHVSPLMIFVASALAIAPLASVLGESTGNLASHCGPAIGGILSATMGNFTEMIIAFFALRAGHINVVKASLSGSIIGNLLLVLGLSLVAGGVRNSVQRFSRTTSSMNTTTLMIAVAALVMPAVFNLTLFGTLQHHDIKLQKLSIWTSGVLIALYLLNMFFVFRTHRASVSAPHPEEKDALIPSRSQAIISLGLATVLVAAMSEILVGQITPVTHALGMTELFVGVIVVALVGNAAENSTAVIMARRNRMDVSMSIATGASTQIALFVAPVLVFLSVAIGRPMTLVFNGFEIAAIVLSVLIVEMISSDGETNWFEGAQLLAVYAIVAVAFYFVPE